jgi:hypothetical protein
VKFASNKKKDFVYVGDFKKGSSQVIGLVSQQFILPSFFQSGYAYSQPVSIKFGLAKIKSADYLNLNIEAMVKKAFKNNNQNQDEDTPFFNKDYNTEKCILDTLPRNSMHLL